MKLNHNTAGHLQLKNKDRTYDLGDGRHSMRYAYDGDQIIGVFYLHDDPDGNECGGFIPIGQGEWTLINQDPPTMMPSLDCFNCDSHGFITDGKWEDARAPHEFHKWSFKFEDKNGYLKKTI